MLQIINVLKIFQNQRYFLYWLVKDHKIKSKKKLVETWLHILRTHLKILFENERIYVNYKIGHDAGSI